MSKQISLCAVNAGLGVLKSALIEALPNVPRQEQPSFDDNIIVKLCDTKEALSVYITAAGGWGAGCETCIFTEYCIKGGK
jgi:hypothetical protein